MRLASILLAVVAAVKAAYAPFGKPTDTLASKVLLGTLGCLPACDRFFVDGFKARGLPYSRLNGLFIERVVRFSMDHRLELAQMQSLIIDRGGPRYPFMKLVDMHFWQIGADMEAT